MSDEISNKEEKEIKSEISEKSRKAEKETETKEKTVKKKISIMSKNKVIVLLILAAIGLLSSLMLLSNTFDMELDVVKSLCIIGNNFNCEIIANVDWVNILGIPQSILLTPIYLGLLTFFVIALFIKNDKLKENFLLIPFIAGIFLLTYSGFLFVNMFFIAPLRPTTYGPINLLLYVINLAMFVVMILSYIESFSSRIIEVVAKKELRIKFLVLPIAMMVCFIIIGVLLNYWSFIRPITLTEEDKIMTSMMLSKEEYQITTDKAPKRGENKKGLEIVIFEDFQCPICRIDAVEIEKLLKYYNYEISLVFKHYPLEPECHPVKISELHPYACEASYASLAAKEQGKFWEYYDLLFSGPLDGIELLEKYAKKLGLDMEKFNKDYASERIINMVKADSAEAHYMHKIKGTPTIFFNGRKYEGPVKFKVLRKVAELVINYPDYEAPEMNVEDYLSEEVSDINTEHSPFIGTDGMGIEIIVFEDFQCPACRRTYEELEKLMTHYDNKIKLILKHYPLEKECFPIKIQDLHEFACEASYAAIAAMKQGKFEEYYHKLFSDRVTGVDLFTKYAEELNLDMDKFNKDYESEEVKDLVRIDTDEGYNTFHITSTPTMFFNGRLYTGPKGFEEFVSVVNYLLKNK